MAVSGRNYAPLFLTVERTIPQGPDESKQRAASGPPGHGLETTELLYQYILARSAAALVSVF